MGLKKLALFGIFLLTALYLISCVNAEILISQPKTVYNLGDEISSTITIDSLKIGYMDINLECAEGEQNLYHSVPESTTISLNRKLIPAYIGNLTGVCSFQVSYAQEIENGQKFEISESIEIELKPIEQELNVGNNLKIAGTVYKKNGELVGQLQNAFVEVSISGENLSSSGTVKDGQFSVDLLVPESTHAGNKAVLVIVYDEDETGSVLNFGQSATQIRVLQILERVDVAIDKLTMNPGENITLIPFAYDKAGDYMSGLISLEVTQNGKSVYQGFIDSSASLVLDTERNNTPGIVKVKASKEGITSEKSYEINSVKNLSIEIGNETLVITNVGNVVYQDQVEIKIGQQSFLEDIYLEVGKSLKYSLSAPNGLYEISIMGESASFNQGGVILTGNAIDISRVREGTDYLFARYPIVWIFLLVVLASLLYIWYRKYQRNMRFGILSLSSYNKPRYQEIKRQGGVQVIKPEEMKSKIDNIILQGELRKAEQVLVLHGRKNPAGIIAIKIKSELKGIANESLKKALEYAYKNKAVSYNAGDFILLIFSPLLTRTMKNEEVAIRAASDIDGYLKDHNRKFRNDKISYGIGVNSGDIINKVEGRVLQFTNVGRTINLAKRIADVTNDDVLLSKDIHEKTPSVKAERFATGAIEAFSIKRIVNTEQSQKFINEFLRRNTTK